MIAADALKELRDALEPSRVKVGAPVAQLDPGWHPNNLAAGVVIEPRSTEEVAKAIRICRKHGIGVVPQGGRTGLVGATISTPGEVVLVSSRMNRIVEIDPVSRVAIVESGVTLEALQQAANTYGLEPGIDIPSRGSATIGGMTSTNAGGIMAFRNGVMRHQILGLEAVLPDGSIYSDLTRVVKNSAGYDLKHLLIGAEGTLGFVTRIALKLDVVESATVSAFVGLPTVAAVLDLIRTALRTNSGHLRAAEAVWHSYFRITSAAASFSNPSVGDHPIYLLLQFGGSDEQSILESLERLMEQSFERYPDMSGVIASSSRQEHELWRLREDTDAMYRVFPSAPSYDVSLPLSAIEGYTARIRADLRTIDQAFDPCMFGHLADGNLHIVMNRAGPFEPALLSAVDAVIYEGLAGLGGSFSAEHGIGTKRIDNLYSCTNQAKLHWMSNIKSSLDPEGLMNPFKVLIPNVRH